MASSVTFFFFHYSVETPVLEKVIKSESASLQDACQPVQRMTKNGGQQRGTAHLSVI